MSITGICKKIKLIYKKFMYPKSVVIISNISFGKISNGLDFYGNYSKIILTLLKTKQNKTSM
jgi:hypothetical protein